VKSQKYLGIYLSKETATVVCLGSQEHDRNILDCFSVSVEEQQNPSMQVLVSLIAQRCTEKSQVYRDAEAAVALDCSMFMQHKVHSEFNDLKQIAATIRFDTEEALATDISDVAVAFKAVSSDQTGSQLTVFTAQRKILSEILLALQSNNIDPVTMEPDVNCLLRFVNKNISRFQPLKAATLFGMLSRRSGYFITTSESQKTTVMRTFLLSPAQNRGDLLTGEIPITTALAGQYEPITQLRVFDSAGSVDYQQLGEKLGIETSTMDLAESAGTGPETLSNCADMIDFAIAYGAALAHLEETQSINFRNDFSPYQGKKVRLQKALKILSISVVVLVLALGAYFQMLSLKTNEYRSKLRKKFAKDYLHVMLNEKTLPPKFKEAARKLGTESRRIESVKQGLLSATGQESIAAKLTMVLKAFNECAAQTNLNVEKISITANNISITGDTSSRKNTLRLFDVIKKGQLDISQQRLSSEGGLDKFSITVATRK
jgi:hypothetical protein